VVIRFVLTVNMISRLMTWSLFCMPERERCKLRAKSESSKQMYTHKLTGSGNLLIPMVTIASNAIALALATL
jgi:hypothetical protein